MLATYPLETLRTRSAISVGSATIPAAIAEIWRAQGIGGFYQVLSYSPPPLSMRRHANTACWY